MHTAISYQVPFQPDDTILSMVVRMMLSLVQFLVGEVEAAIAIVIHRYIAPAHNTTQGIIDE